MSQRFDEEFVKNFRVEDIPPAMRERIDEIMRISLELGHHAGDQMIRVLERVVKTLPTPVHEIACVGVALAYVQAKIKETSEVDPDLGFYIKSYAAALEKEQRAKGTWGKAG